MDEDDFYTDFEDGRDDAEEFELNALSRDNEDGEIGDEDTEEDDEETDPDAPESDADRDDGREREMERFEVFGD